MVLFTFSVCMLVCGCVRAADGESDCGHARPWHGHEDEKPKAPHHRHSSRHDRCVCVHVHVCGYLFAPLCLLAGTRVGKALCSLIGFVPVLMHNTAVNFAEHCALCRAEGGSWSFLSLSLFYFSAPVLLTRPRHHRVVDPEVLHLWRGWVSEKYM